VAEPNPDLVFDCDAENISHLASHPIEPPEVEGLVIIMPRKKLVIPSFRNEKDEAAWWERHRAEVEADLRHAMRQQKTLSLSDVLAQAKRMKELLPVTIRLASDDIATARQLASGKGIGYQTYIKLLLHEALAKEAGRQARSSRS
jgi:predicted DNA binding CopG/RHH family protein